MNRKRAFTLIELLVVIAIIAILAAILFPVFAQAKLQAKKAASISNAKQITLSNIMYENDYDDYFVLAGDDFMNWECGIAAASGKVGCFNNYPNATPAWPQLLDPYIKTFGLYVEPATGDPNGVFTSGSSFSFGANWNAHAGYGYNYTFLAPLSLGGLTGGGTLPSSYAGQIPSLGRSSTAAVNPAGTVMFAGDQGFATVSSTNVVNPSGAYPATGDFDLAVPPGVLGNLYAAPDRLVYVGAVGLASQDWAMGWTANTPVGPTTSDTRAIYPYNNAVCGFLDGHAKVENRGTLSAGTDGGNTTEVFSTPVDTYTCTCGSQITNMNAYMWSLDGTLTDVN